MAAEQAEFGQQSPEHSRWQLRGPHTEDDSQGCAARLPQGAIMSTPFRDFSLLRTCRKGRHEAVVVKEHMAGVDTVTEGEGTEMKGRGH